MRTTQFAHCSLLTTHHSLLTTRYSLLTTRYSLLTTHCSLLTAHYSLLTAHCLLLTTHYSLLTTHCSLLTQALFGGACAYDGGKIVYAIRKLGLGDLSEAARAAHWSVSDELTLTLSNHNP